MKYSERARGGIYAIRNKVNGKLYVGSAVSFYHRWATHKSDLRKNEHDNAKLQNAWNKYGEGSFIFSVLEEINDISALLYVEQFYLDVFFGKDCYNILPKAESRLGFTNSEDEKLKWTKHKNVTLRSPSGELFETSNLKTFARDHGIHHSALLTVVSGKAKHHRGWRLPDTELPMYSLAHEDGRIVHLYTGELETFCELNKLGPTPLRKVAIGKQKWHNGWYAVCIIGKPHNTPGEYLRGNYKQEILDRAEKIMEL